MRGRTDARARGFESVRGANFSVLKHVLTSWTGPLTFKQILRLLSRYRLSHPLHSRPRLRREG